MKTSLKARLSGMLALLCTLSLLLGVFGLYGMHKTTAGLRTVYEHNTVALEMISRIDSLIVRNQLALARTLIDPKADIKTEAAFIENNIAEINRTWSAFAAGALTAEEKRLADTFAANRTRMDNEGMFPSVAALRTGNVAAAKALQDKFQALLPAVSSSMDALRKLQVDAAKQEYQEAMDRYIALRRAAVVAIILGTTLAALFGFCLIRNLYRDLGGEPEYAAQIVRSIANGDLTLTIQTHPDDRKSLLFAMKVMQQNLAHTIGDLKRTKEDLLSSCTKLKEANRRQEELHRQLVQSEKMASIGQLAAGVAHEINNPIAFVNSNLSILRDYTMRLSDMLAAYAQLEAVAVEHPRELEKVQQLRATLELDYLRNDMRNVLEESLDGVQRICTIVQNLKEFSHAGEAERQWVDLRPGLDSTLNIVWNEIKNKAHVVKAYGDIPLIEAQPAQLNQVFMNLLVNAAHAIERRGTITIRTGHEGKWVWVEVADDGAGIAPQHLNRIFEPFFTTKPIGQGTGLGLSVSYGIVQQHGGKIDVQSEVGRGTTFRVWLPFTLPATKDAEKRSV